MQRSGFMLYVREDLPRKFIPMKTLKEGFSYKINLVVPHCDLDWLLKKFENIFFPFHTTGLFLYSLKTLENQKFPDVFMRYRKRPLEWKGLVCEFSTNENSVILTHSTSSIFWLP